MLAELAILHLQGPVKDIQGAMVVGDDDDAGLLLVGDGFLAKSWIILGGIVAAGCCSVWEVVHAMG